MNNNNHIGSNFDDFLKEEEILEEIEEVVATKISIFQTSKKMSGKECAINFLKKKTGSAPREDQAGFA